MNLAKFHQIQFQLAEAVKKYEGLSDDTPVIAAMPKGDFEQLLSLLSRLNICSTEKQMDYRDRNLIDNDEIAFIKQDIGATLGQHIINCHLIRFSQEIDHEQMLYNFRGTVICVMPPEDGTAV